MCPCQTAEAFVFYSVTALGGQCCQRPLSLSVYIRVSVMLKQTSTESKLILKTRKLIFRTTVRQKKHEPHSLHCSTSQHSSQSGPPSHTERVEPRRTDSSTSIGQYYLQYNKPEWLLKHCVSLQYPHLISKGNTEALSHLTFRV